jgi:glucan phosphoethanolaminetransferase (alkaline phosphatase superfamily)
MSINGYERKTTPLLEGEGVISFSAAISQAPNTIRSTPLILTRKTPQDGASFPEKSLITAFKEAGFKTWYVSYLTKANLGDDAVNIIANEADQYITASPRNDVMDHIRSDGAKKKLIVYKTVGSHFPYHIRYPRQFEIWRPTFTVDTYKNPTIEDRQKLVNAYDNSLRYSVDGHAMMFLDHLKKEDGLAFLAFISDHGTAIFEDGKSLYGGASRANYNIGLFFWFNEAYKRLHAPLVDALAGNRRKRVSAFCFLDTMFDLGFISTEKRKGCSLLDSNPDSHKRLVQAKVVLDYDVDIQL